MSRGTDTSAAKELEPPTTDANEQVDITGLLGNGRSGQGESEVALAQKTFLGPVTLDNALSNAVTTFGGFAQALQQLSRCALS